jgi:hypothetical protein
MLAEELRRVEVHLAAEDLGKLGFHPKEVEPWYVIGLELDQHIDIAVGTEILSQDRPKQGQAPDVVPPAEFGHPLSWHVDARAWHVPS